MATSAAPTQAPPVNPTAHDRTPPAIRTSTLFLKQRVILAPSLWKESLQRIVLRNEALSPIAFRLHNAVFLPAPIGSWLIMDSRQIVCSKAQQLQAGRFNSAACMMLDRQIKLHARMGGQWHNPPLRLLKRTRVGEICTRLESSYIPVGQSGLIFPKRKVRQGIAPPRKRGGIGSIRCDQQGRCPAIGIRTHFRKMASASWPSAE